MVDNKLIQLLSEGYSWGDSIAAEEQARLLDQGKIDLWRAEVIAKVEANGLPRTLLQIAYSYRDVTAWGTYLSAVLSFLKLSELYGLACDPAELVKRVADENPTSWEKAEKIAKKIAIEYLEKQIEKGDVFLLRPSDITSSDLLVYVPMIIEKRRQGIENVAAFTSDDGLIDMFDFLELPIAMDLMVQSGIGGRASQSAISPVLKRIAELEIAEVTTPERERKGAGQTSIEERYLRVFSNCLPHQRDLLRGTAMALDPDDSVCKKGIEMIYNTGHIHCKEALLRALDRDNDEIRRKALLGLGILGEKDTIESIGNLFTNPSNEVRKALCKALGQLKATDYLDEIQQFLRSGQEDLQLAAMNTLLEINTEEALDTFWNYFRRFGMTKLSTLSKDIANTGTRNAELFLVNLLLLDIQAFIDSGEIGFYNAMINAREEAEKLMLNLFLEKIRDQAVWGFSRLGGKAVPILVSLLKMFSETTHFMKTQDDEDWHESERPTREMLENRARQMIRLPIPDTIPRPVNETIRALGITRSVRAIPYLKELAKVEEENLALLAIEALGEIDTPAIDAIIEVPEKTLKIKMMKIRQIGTIIHPSATEWLIKQLDDEDPLVRMEVSTFLAMRNDISLTKHLMRSAKDSHAGVRAGLANVISRLGMTTFPEIMDVLSKDKEDSVRDVIIRAKLHYEADEDDDYWA